MHTFTNRHTHECNGKCVVYNEEIITKQYLKDLFKRISLKQKVGMKRNTKLFALNFMNILMLE